MYFIRQMVTEEVTWLPLSFLFLPSNILRADFGNSFWTLLLLKTLFGLDHIYFRRAVNEIFGKIKEGETFPCFLLFLINL